VTLLPKSDSVNRRAAVVVLQMNAGIAQVRDGVVLDHPPVSTNFVPGSEKSA
jgi:hypothetical protein